MKIKTFFTILVLGFALSSYSQKATIHISFTAYNNMLHVPMDSVEITNITQGGDTTLYYPDTTLTLNYTTTGLNDKINQEEFRLSQNYPNPFSSRTTFDVYMPENGELAIGVYDLSGREIVKFVDDYSFGNHTFSFISDKGGLYLLNMILNNEVRTMKMYSIGGNIDNQCEILYVGSDGSGSATKSTEAKAKFPYSLGDQLVAFGYSLGQFHNIVFTPTNDTVIEFSLQGPVICPPTLLDVRDSTVYAAVKIGNQCWMAENLNIGARVDGVIEQTDNGTIEKYCYDDNTANCIVYGGLYYWGEMMQYVTPQGSQGICPAGWHVPTDAEWKILEGVVDSQFGVGDPEWDKTDWRGFDAGNNLRETGVSHWDPPNSGATNSSGFTALPGGSRFTTGTFIGMGMYGHFWSSTESATSYAWARDLNYNSSGSNRYNYNHFQTLGLSVRCIKN